ncbi:MAG: EsaB/YukD family protein [Vulcanimicrobiota bacterium]
MSETCLLSVRHEDHEWDLEVPNSVAADELLKLLQQALNLPLVNPPLKLYVAPLGIPLAGQQNLVQAGVLDGAVLVLSASPPEAGHSGKDLIRDNPAVKWKSIEGATPESAPAPEQPAAGYVWKKL